MRIVILVGAGASVGAFDLQSSKPPLGSQLFTTLSESFPETWGSLRVAVSNEFLTSGFELGMAALRAEPVSIQGPLIDMGVFFANFRIPSPGVNRYFALVKLLDSLSVSPDYVFASLNYETLLEQSLGKAGHPTNYWGTPPPNLPKPIRVIKPHGSSNFAFDQGTNRFRNNTFIGVGTYVGGGGARLKVIDIDRVREEAESGFPPAMSLYAPGKPDLVCPEFVASLRNDWASEVADSDLIVVIGARPQLTNDVHIWTPILDSNSDILFVGSVEPDFEAGVESRIKIRVDTFESGLPLVRDFFRETLS
jgi:hypothetical protein